MSKEQYKKPLYDSESDEVEEEEEEEEEEDEDEEEDVEENEYDDDDEEEEDEDDGEEEDDEEDENEDEEVPIVAKLPIAELGNENQKVVKSIPEAVYRNGVRIKDIDQKEQKYINSNHIRQQPKKADESSSEEYESDNESDSEQEETRVTVKEKMTKNKENDKGSTADKGNEEVWHELVHCLIFIYAMLLFICLNI